MNSPRIALSTVSAHLVGIEPGFRMAADLGYDGVEVMVGYHPDSRNSDRLQMLSRRYELPVLAIHAPTLVATTPVWGVNPMTTVTRTVDLAERLGVNTVIAHPPFQVQDPAARYLDHIRHLEHRSGVVVAVENLYPVRIGRRMLNPYTPGWNLLSHDADHVTLDTSHAAAARQDSLALAEALGDRLTHVHLADGESGGRDRHLPPGSGAQPLARLLEALADRSWLGTVTIELAAKPFRSRVAHNDARDAIAFTRRHLEPVRSEA